MKTKTLLMVAGAGALVYWLWKKNNKGSEIAKENASTKSECERSGGDWVETHCIAAPCRGICVK